MASVRMTIELREQITENYRKQCQAAFDKDFDVESTIINIVEATQKQAGEDFKTLLQSAHDFSHKLFAHENKYKDIHTVNYSSVFGSISNLNEGYNNPLYGVNEDEREFYPLRKLEKLHLVCNRNRCLSENFDTIKNWRSQYKSRWEEKMNDATASYVTNDMYFMHTFEKPVDFPFITKGDDSSYDSSEDYAPSVAVGLVISDPEMCDKLQQIPLARQKTSDMVQKFKEFIEPITTLKRFIDEFPGGRSLVPAGKLQTMAAPAVKKERKAKVQAEDLLTPTMKQEFNEVMLESSLLGGNND